MESYLQALPKDLHNIINNYVKDQIELTIEDAKDFPTLIIKSGRVTQKIIVNNLHWNYKSNKEDFFGNILEKGDIDVNLKINSFIHLRFIRKNNEISLKFILQGFEFYTDIELPGSYKDKIFEYLNMLKPIPVTGMSGPTGPTGGFGIAAQGMTGSRGVQGQQVIPGLSNNPIVPNSNGN